MQKPVNVDIEKQEWLESMASILAQEGELRAKDILRSIQDYLLGAGINLEEATLNTPYRNTIGLNSQPPYPGDIDLETKIENIIRWNAMAMVLQGYDSGTGVGGHIATYASAATMLEVGFNHFFRKQSDVYGGDIVNVQAHASPGVYARALLEGRISIEQAKNFRRELQAGGGLCSYPHPRRMPDFWQMPTASMGLSTPSSIYLAKFSKYLESRDLKPANGGKIWTFIGDGESDEPEVLGTINMAARENLDNLVLIVNCNLQRLDGPVRGNGKIIQELERSFRGACWNVIKVIWSGEWDGLFSRDEHGILQQRMEQAVDGDYQWYSVASGKDVRQHWVRDNPKLEELMKTLSDEEIRCIRRGGHDHNKLYAAFDQATKTTGKPTVILVKTIKGYGMGNTAEGQNTAHQKKQLSDEERLSIAKRLGIPLDEEQIKNAEFYIPNKNSVEVQYLQKQRHQLGGYLPSRKAGNLALQAPKLSLFKSITEGSNERAISTTMGFVRVLSNLLKDKKIGKYIVPIIPDEARTFGMEGLFPSAGIYSHCGQRYQPVDAGQIVHYKEASNGQILQEGICETGAMASFLAAGTAYSIHDVPTIPFYVFYSIFGFQRVGDMIWACGDMLCKGFLLGGTAGRTTLNGEGLQHQDGHSHIVASTVPNLLSYDPAFTYEVAVIICDGIYRMYEQQENIFYYITLYNENYAMPAMPEGVEEGILRGIYCYQRATPEDKKIHLLGSGSIMSEVIKAAEILQTYAVAADIWSVTSYNELYRDAINSERWNRLHPTETAQVPYIEQIMQTETGPFVAASDYVKAMPERLSRWLPDDMIALGTDGYGLSESREDLRDHFEVSANYIAFTALYSLHLKKSISLKCITQAIKELNINPDKLNPFE
ncbi:MAG: pyruvate dehydrogenase E1 component [Kiritimatiellia bacterium]|jgi:pyruvate dehydrogenase E1 component